MTGGYLQRLVTAVAGRGDSIHPRTGSIFSPHGEETNPPLHGWEDAHTVTAVQPQTHADGTSMEREQLVPDESVRPKSERVSLLANTIAQDTRSTDRAVPPLFAASRPDGRAVGPGDELGVQSTRSRLSLASGVDVSAPVLGAADHGFRPLIRPNGLARSDAALFEPRPLPQERTSRVERQVDDIQIHIGRIEVTAVRSAALAAPKTPERSLSLDAYLNRRNGRAR
jgi:hypothetical protein